MSDWFYTSDLHGQGFLYEQLLALAAAHRPRVVLIGGDLCPHASEDEAVQRQRLFIQGFLVEFARRLRDATPETDLLLLMGNDDCRSNQDCLDEQDGKLWRSLHERVVVVEGTAVAGLSWVPITPFRLKDWERWEDGAEESPARLDGWVSRGDTAAPHHFDPDQRSPTIAEALQVLEGSMTPGEGVCVFHSPPRNTSCDVTRRRAHVGSRAIRNFVERHQPALVLSGHIHESPQISAAYRDTIGRTTVVNPGQFQHARLCGVWFDPTRLDHTLRHTVYG